jgi:catechol 2,3-dioxygenase-like lactoylglutathione lyase family enzyme
LTFLGIDCVEFGASDLKLAKKFFSDWGLLCKSFTSSKLVFETQIGSQIIIRPEASKLLRPKISPDSQFREVIFGVRTVADLVAIAKELSVDREVEQDEDGTLHTVDDSGIQIGFRVWTHTLEKPQVGTIWNSPGNRRRINQVSPVYASATPFKMGHIVFFVPDTKRAEDFYRQRLGFCLSDRYVGGAGVFLRWAQQSEHHNLFFIKSRKNDVNLHHIAFEVNDVHEMLGGGVAFSKKGWATEVGPGRHPISSAYFWYFKNPLGGAIEYFCDSDYVNADWKPRQYRINRFSEWHLADGIVQRDDGKIRPSLAAAQAMKAKKE